MLDIKSCWFNQSYKRVIIYKSVLHPINSMLLYILEKKPIFYGFSPSVFFLSFNFSLQHAVKRLTSLTLSLSISHHLFLSSLYPRCLCLACGSNAIRQTQTKLLKVPWKMLTVHCPQCWPGAELTAV